MTHRLDEPRMDQHRREDADIIPIQSGKDQQRLKILVQMSLQSLTKLKKISFIPILEVEDS